MIEELVNPSDEAAFEQWVTEQSGKVWKFEYRAGGMIFVYDLDHSLIGVVDKDVVSDVLGRQLYHQIKSSREEFVDITL